MLSTSRPMELSPQHHTVPSRRIAAIPADESSPPRLQLESLARSLDEPARPVRILPSRQVVAAAIKVVQQIDREVASDEWTKVEPRGG